MARSILFILSVLLSGHTIAQTLLFGRVTSLDGLPSNDVNTLFEDRDGFIWAGTGEGLARLEGTRVRVFHHDHNDSTSLAHDQVNDIAQGASGTLWFATMNGLAQLDPLHGTFINRRIVATGIHAHQANRMRQLIALGDSLLWVVTEAGLYRYVIDEGAFVRVQDWAPGESPAGSVMSAGALCWDESRSTLWAATTKGLASWDPASGMWTDHRTTHAEPWSSSAQTNAPVLHGDTLWFLREDSYELYAFDLRTGSLRAEEDVESTPNHFGLRCQAFDPQGGHWLSTWTHRLFHRPAGGAWREIHANEMSPGGLMSTRVRRMMNTSKGEQWFATDKGIAVLQPDAKANTVIRFDPALGISVIRPWGADTLLIGTHGGGVGILDLRNGTSTKLTRRLPEEVGDDLFEANFIHAIQTMQQGTLGVCTSRGMAELLPSVPRLRTLHAINGSIPRGSTAAFTFAAQADGALWMGTWSRGLWRCEALGGTCVLVDTVDGPYGRLPSRYMLCWFTDRSGRHWIGMNNGGGLARYEKGRFRAVTDARGANIGGVVRCMADDAEGRLWLGTHEQGIVVYDPRDGSTRYLTRRDGLPGTRILALLFTRDGSIWVATMHGYARMAPGARTFQAVSLPTGLRESEPSTAMVQLVDGRIALAMGGTILLHDPLKSVPFGIPEPRLTSYRVNDEITLGGPPPLRLQASRKALTLELGVVGFCIGGIPLFRYRISPHDTGWKELGAAKRLDLFDLAPGDYTIDVQASVDGVHWSPRSTQAHVAVLPHFYATWWFRTILVLLIAFTLIAGFRRYLADRLRSQREALERQQAVLAERMRIASDMHDDLGAGLSALKLRSEMALRVEKDPGKREQLGSLARTAGEIMGSMRQIIWTMNADQSSISDLASYITNYARGYCTENGLKLEITTPSAWPGVELSSEQRRNVFLVVKEALHNTVKHANASAVRFSMNAGDELVVETQDNGVGLPVSAKETVGNGLRNMRKRIEALSGELHVEATDGGGGTRVRFTVPLPTPNQGSIGRNGTGRDIRGA